MLSVGLGRREVILERDPAQPPIPIEQRCEAQIHTRLPAQSRYFFSRAPTSIFDYLFECMLIIPVEVRPLVIMPLGVFYPRLCHLSAFRRSISAVGDY